MGAAVWLCAWLQLIAAGVTAQDARDAGAGTRQDARTAAELVAAARAALHEGELARALGLARRAAEADPEDAEALTVLGLVEFRRGDHAVALHHFDAAIAASGGEPSAALLWNRGACLSALGRPADAEQAYLAAAARANPPFDALCLVNAGLAALDAGAPRRARAQLESARARDRGHELDEELSGLQQELDAESAGRRERLRALLERGALARAEHEAQAGLARDPDDPQLLYLAGITAYRCGDRDHARARLTRARSLGLDPARSAIARDYLDLIAGGLRLEGHGPHAEAELGGGYDSNAVQAGLGDSNPLLIAAATHGGAYARLRAQLRYGFSPEPEAFVVARYEAEQLAYAPAALDEWNAQQHTLSLEAERRVAASARLGGLVLGGLDFAGLSGLRVLSLSAGSVLWAELEHGRDFRTRILPAVVHTQVVDDALSFLTSTRLELTLEERYRRHRLSATAFAGYRADLLGTQRVSTSVPEASCPGCSARYVIPLAYHGPRVGLRIAHPAWEALRVELRASIEARFHPQATYLELGLPAGLVAVGPRYERDIRVSAGLGAVLQLPEPFELEADYDLIVARSNIDNTQGGEHALDYANLSYLRHVVWVGATAAF